MTSYDSRKMTDGGWNFQVQCVNLANLCINAGQSLGMVIVQPGYELIPDGSVPFRISNEYRNAQKDLIEKAFQIRVAESEERNVPIPFILFPEFAIPLRNPDGLDCLQRQIEQVEEDIIFIGGLEGLNPQEAQDVADRLAPGVDVAKPTFTAGRFVNLCVIVVKSANGQSSWYFQAKLRPSQWEQPRNMAHGERVLYFFAPLFTFLCQICFDHIAAQGQEPLNTVLYRQLIERTQPNTATLDFVFVPQCNEKPDKSSVRENTGHLLNYQHRALKNDMTVAVVVNKAAGVQEPSKYGRSGFHYRQGRWQTPTMDIGPKGYELYDSDCDRVTSAVFRKRTQAIHVATLIPPSYNIGDSGNPRHPLDNPRSYLISEGCDPDPCSCLPGSSSAVGMFVECDCLPCKLRDSLLRNLPNTDRNSNRWRSSDIAPSSFLVSHYDEIRKALLALNCKRAGELLDLLFLHREGGKCNPDTWQDRVEVDAVHEFAAAMSVLRDRGKIYFQTEARWTAVFHDKVAIAVLDGENVEYCHDLATRYWEQYENYSCEPRYNPLLIVALRSQGRVSPIIQEFQPRYSETQTPRPDSEFSPYEPARRRAFLCRDDLFQEARRAPSLGDYLTRVMGGIQ